MKRSLSPGSPSRETTNNAPGARGQLAVPGTPPDPWGRSVQALPAPRVPSAAESPAARLAAPAIRAGTGVRGLRIRAAGRCAPGARLWPSGLCRRASANGACTKPGAPLQRSRPPMRGRRLARVARRLRAAPHMQHWAHLLAKQAGAFARAHPQDPVQSRSERSSAPSRRGYGREHALRRWHSSAAPTQGTGLVVAS